MSEWLKEHAWKAIPTSLTERHQHTSLRIRFNELRLEDAPGYHAINVSVFRGIGPHLTQFLHSSELHLLVYERMFVDVRRRVRG
jgi:hypothetical protein